MNFIDNLTVAERSLFYDVSEEVAFEKGTLLVEIGTYHPYIYFIEKGCARYFIPQNGDEITTYFAFEGDFVAVFSRYDRQDPSRISVEITEDSVLRRIPFGLVKDKIHDDHALALLAIQLMEIMLEQQAQRLFTFQSMSAGERYRQLIENHPYLLQRVKLGDLASYLGISQVSLSRIRARMGD